MMQSIARTRAARLWWALLVLATILMAALGSAAPKALANDIQPYTLVKNTNYVSAGYGGMRTIGTGTIQLSGVTGTVTRALLYWHGPTNSTDPTVNATVSFAGHAVTGTNIGMSSDNCWGFVNSQAYRADVTGLVTGNGAYALSNFTKSGAEVNGASLIVFYNNAASTNKRDIVIFDGNDSNATNSYDADGWNVTLPGINYTSGTANIELHISDGQIGASFADGEIDLNGSSIAPAGQIFSGSSVPNGASAAATSGGLWDIKSFNITGALKPGSNTISLTSSYNADCLSMIAAVIDLPAGAAPGTLPPPRAPTTPPPGTTPPTSSTTETPAKHNPAQVYIVQQPTPNYAATPGSIVTYTLKVKNIGKGQAKSTTVTLPINPAAADVLDAVFSSKDAWVTQVTSTTLVFKTGPIAGPSGEVDATIRLKVKADAKPAATLTDRASLHWSDAASGGGVSSNLPILTVGGADDNRPTYSLSVEPAAGPAGTTFAFGSGIFVPYEPVGLWYNTPDGKVIAGPTYFAKIDGSLSVTLNDSLAVGSYSMVFYGHWSEFTAVGPFAIK
jgi:hypothetical protein